MHPSVWEWWYWSSTCIMHENPLSNDKVCGWRFVSLTKRIVSRYMNFAKQAFGFNYFNSVCLSLFEWKARELILHERLGICQNVIGKVRSKSYANNICSLIAFCWILELDRDSSGSDDCGWKLWLLLKYLCLMQSNRRKLLKALNKLLDAFSYIRLSSSTDA